MHSDPRVRRRLAAGGAGALCVLAAGAAALPLSAAKAVAPDNLAVFSATSAATPYGIVSRVPAETAGGLLFSSTRVDLGKSQAMAAGFTLGPLGDLFVVSSAPPGTITSVPTVITAQEPPQAQSPNEATFAGGRTGGDANGEVRNFTLDARANDVPSAAADAAGNAVRGALFSAGASTSSSDSDVAPDGTVVTKALTAVQNIALGAPGAQLTIAQASSLATITIAPGKKPVTVLTTRIYGAQLAGVPVTIDENGIALADQVAVPASAIAAFNSGLASIQAQGITFGVTPRVQSASAEGASISGAAFTYRYQVPESIPRPSDIGTDQTFSVASVTANATARVRSSIGPPQVDGIAPAGSADSAGGPAAGVDAARLPAVAPATGAPALGLAGPGTGVPAAGVAAPSTDLEFLLPVRVSDPLPDQFRDSYRYVLLAAVAGVIAIAVLARSRNA